MVFKKIKKNIYLKLVFCLAFRILNSITNYKNTFGNKEMVKISRLAILHNVKFKVKGKFNTIRIGEGAVLKNLTIAINGDNNLVDLGKDVRFYEKGKILINGDNSQVIVNEKTTIGSANLFCDESDRKIIMGIDCMLSRDITIQTGDFHSILDLNTGKRINKPEDVIIGNHVWIGNQSILLKGTVISDNSILGIASLANKKFTEENVVIAGIPAKIVKTNINWDRVKLQCY